MPKPKARGNGQGSAYRRGRGWEACVTLGMVIPEDPEKKPYPRKLRKAGFATKKEALAYCPVLLAGGSEKPSEAPRLQAYWETYLKGEFTKLSRSKQTAYRIAWGKLTPLHLLRVDRISVDALRSAVSAACTTYYPARDCRSLLANLFNIAAADGFANKDLPSFIVLPALEEKEREPFTASEQSALWRLYESGDRRAAIPLLMIYTGMMPGEAFGLRKEHIDLDSRQIVHAGLKTRVRKATPIVIADAILPILEDLLSTAQPSGYIFRRVESDWYADYYAALEAAGCRRLTPYSCRHTTATALAISEGVAPQTVRRVMRWSTTRMLDRYAHPDTSDALSAVNTLKGSSTAADQQAHDPAADPPAADPQSS